MLYDESADTLDVRGATAAAPGVLKLTTGELTNVDGGILGRLEFQAPLDSAGTDAILVAASIWAEADATFSATVNTTDLVFATATSATATEKMRIDSAGKVGIGTASPLGAVHVQTGSVGSILPSTSADELVIEGGAHSGMTIYSGTTSVGSVYFGDVDDDFTGQVSYDHGSDVITLGTQVASGGQISFNVANNSAAVRIDASGNVGIGTASPLGKAHIESATAGAISPDAAADELIIENSGHAGMTIYSGTTSVGSIYFGDSGDDVGARVAYDHNAKLLNVGSHEPGGQVAFYTANSAEMARFDASGNVGIGTATFGASAAGVLAIANGTQGAALANAIQVVSEDLSASNTIPSIRTEGTAIYSAGTPAAATGSIAIKVNGTVYYFTVSTTAAA